MTFDCVRLRGTITVNNTPNLRFNKAKYQRKKTVYMIKQTSRYCKRLSYLGTMYRQFRTTFERNVLLNNNLFNIQSRFHLFHLNEALKKIPKTYHFIIHNKLYNIYSRLDMAKTLTKPISTKQSIVPNITACITVI